MANRQTFSQALRAYKVHWTLVDLRDFSFIAAGALLQALAMRLFLVPMNLVSGGVSGIAQLINYYTDFPIGLMVFLGNIPLFLLGWRHLGGMRFAIRTAFAVIAFSIFTDLLVFILPTNGLTSDLVLNTLYGGVASGIGYGLVYRGRGTSGGSDILARILSPWRGISISQSYLLTDSLVILSKPSFVKRIPRRLWLLGRHMKFSEKDFYR
ncbi:MAG TPA: YitT family protein [Anaerolineales bacterium]|nr:YitT family protein [Anaerolineales bacterium]